jgi:lipopolysaccharide exporter
MLLKIRQALARRDNLRAHFWQSAANYFQQVSGLALGIFLARLLSPEIFGEFAYVAAVMGLFVLPASWSLAPQIVAEVRSHPEIINDGLHISRIIVLPRAALILTACLFLYHTAGTKQAVLGAVIGIPLVGHEHLAVLRSSMEGNGNFKLNFMDSILTALATACIALPAAWLGAGVWALALPALPLFVGQLVLFHRFTGLRFATSLPRSNRSYWKSATSLWLATCSDTALLRLDKFFLGRYSTLDAVGDYNRALNYTPLAARLLSSFITNPTVAALTKTALTRSRFLLIAKSLLLLCLAGALNFLFWWHFAASLVPWLFGEQWTSAVPVFEAMAPLSLALAVAYFPVTIALANRRYKTLAFVRTFVVTCFIGAVALLSSTMDAVTMAYLFQTILILQGLLLSVAMLVPRMVRNIA